MADTHPTSNLDELRRVAEAAHEFWDSVEIRTSGGITGTRVVGIFVSEFNPSNALELLAEVAVARERLGPAGYKLLEELRTLRSQVERMRAGLEDARDGLASAADIIGNCAMERCVPSVCEAHSAGAYLADACDLLSSLPTEAPGGGSEN